MHVWPQDNVGGLTIGRRTRCEDFTEAAALLGVEFLARPVQTGDLYLAGRNTGIKLLTAKFVNEEKGWVEPDDQSFYVYDTHECYAVVDPS